MTTQLHKQLFGYHAWANAALFETLETLDRQAHADTLHTILRLLNHAYVVSRIFQGHLTGVPHGYVSDNTEETPTLSELRAEVTAIDGWYQDYVSTTSPDALEEAIGFTFTDGDRGLMTRSEMLTQVVLHSIVHRGEVARLLWQLKITPPWDTFAVYLHQTESGRRIQATTALAS